MSEIVLISIAAFVTSTLTFFSGFGLGTILTPVFAVFFPVEVAIALTGVVHFMNNTFKLILVGNKIDRHVAVRFGIPAFLTAFIGAFLLVQLSDLPSIASYSLGSKMFFITPVKIVIAFLLMGFVFIESLLPLREFKVTGRRLFLGGALSGFFGGLSGNQGALRSAFLIKADLTKESYIATGVVIACLVDFSRLTVYFTRFNESGLTENLNVVTFATLSAFLGAFLGSRMLVKITMKTVQVIVMTMLILLSLALGTGLI